MCNGDHNIYKCSKFKELNVEARIKIAHEKGLCFNCLKVGHRASLCTSDRKCSVFGCSKGHCICCKGYLWMQEAVQAVMNHKEVSKVQLMCDCWRKTFGHWDRHCQDSTIIGSGSTTSFCTESLAKSIGIKGKHESLALSTLMSFCWFCRDVCAWVTYQWCAWATYDSFW